MSGQPGKTGQGRDVAAVDTAVRPRLLIVDGDTDAATALTEVLVRRGYEVLSATDTIAAHKAVATLEPEIALVDIRLGPESGMELINRLKRERPQLLCIAMAAHADMKLAIGALRDGACDFLRKPIGNDHLQVALGRCDELVRLRRDKERTDAAHKESEARLRDFIDNAHSAMYLKDKEGRYLLVNDSASSQYGLPKHELIGKTVYDIHPRAEAEATVEHDREILRLGVPSEAERELTSPDGSRFNIIAVKFPVRDASREIVGVGGINIDITARKQAERALKASQEAKQALLTAAEDSIFLLRRDGTILEANQAAAGRLGATLEGILGKSIFELVPSYAGGLRLALLARLDAGESFDFEDQRAGRRYEIHVRPVSFKHGKAERFAVFARDITELAAANASLIEAKEEADLASHVKSEFLANTSHELRTPLNAIIGFADMLDGGYVGTLNQKQAEYVGDIRASGAALLELINDILDLSKIESGKAQLYEEDVDVGRAVHATMRMVKERADTAELRLSADIAEGLPGLRADSRMFKRMLLNLLSNAVKFTPAGGTVTVDASIARDGGFRLAVSDTGIGIEAENLAVAMAPFGQVDSTLNRRYRGTGLGLPLVKSMIELHGGDIELESAAGAGTTAAVRFPSERILRRDASAQPSPLRAR